MCDRKALARILATQPSPQVKAKLKNWKEATAEFAGIEAMVNSRMRNLERSGGASELDREAVKKLNHEILEKCRIYERIRAEVDGSTKEILGSDNPFCHWVNDGRAHLEDMNAGWSHLWSFCEDHENGVFDTLLDEESCEGLFQCTGKIVANFTALETMLRHSLLASRALETEVPDAVMKALEDQPELLGKLRDQLFSDLYADAVASLAEQDAEEVIAELFKTLYPKDWEALVLQTDPGALEKNGERAEVRKWKEDLKRRHPAAYLTMSDVAKLREFAYDDIDKAEPFVKLVEEGMLPSDALFLLFRKASDRQIEFHLSVDMCLCLEGLRHADIFHATKRLDDEKCAKLAQSMNSYSRWLRTMPKEMPDEGKQVISAMLAINAGTPQNSGEVFGILMQNAIGVTGELQRSSPELVGDFFAYFVSYWPESKGQPGRALACAPPHESLAFDEKMNYYIGQDEISAEDVRLALAYAMKGSEGNENRGGRYISSTAFRKALKKVLPRNDVNDVLPYAKRDPIVRASEVEVHLARQGVMVYSRNDQLIGLNMDKAGKRRTEQEPSERGTAILRVTREWMVERDRLARGGFTALPDEAPSPLPAGAEGAEANAGQGIFGKAQEAIREYCEGAIQRFLSEGDIGTIVGALRERLAKETDGQREADAKKEMVLFARELVEGHERDATEIKKEFDARLVPGENKEAG